MTVYKLIAAAGITFPLLAMFVFAVAATDEDDHRAMCKELGEATGKRTMFLSRTGCYVLVDGEWIPDDKWRGAP